jgi:hypothetical protein
MRNTLLVGMNNPYSDDPRRALFPSPVGCTGWRIWKMLNARTGARRGQYLQAFHRINLITSGNWHDGDAARNWRSIEEEVYARYDTVVLFGKAVQRAVGISCGDVMITRSLICVPHPSGLNRWYNSDFNRQIVELLLEELYTESVSA